MNSTGKRFSYPVYLVGRTNIAAVNNEAELRGFETWILFDEDSRYPGYDLRPFDARNRLLSHRDIPLSGGSFDLYYDPGRDHADDAYLLRSLLITMLSEADDDAVPVHWEALETEGLLTLALRFCPL